LRIEEVWKAIDEISDLWPTPAYWARTLYCHPLLTTGPDALPLYMFVFGFFLSTRQAPRFALQYTGPRKERCRLRKERWLTQLFTDEETPPLRSSGMAALGWLWQTASLGARRLTWVRERAPPYIDKSQSVLLARVFLGRSSKVGGVLNT